MAQTVLTAEPGLPFVDITRAFNNTPELLLRAHTDPALFSQWFGKRSMTITDIAFDAKHGGCWHYVVGLPDGSEAAFRGVFHGDPSTDGITRTFELVGMPGASIETTTFESTGSTTILRHRTVFNSVDERDFVVACATYDFTEEYERIDELIERLSPVGSAA